MGKLLDETMAASRWHFHVFAPRYMEKLDTKIIQSGLTPLRLVSFAFEIPNKQQSAAKKGVLLYEYL